ncbi:hypothetical protein CEXT_709291 [Caerostris extrusa]|uniref:Uncharacterized protein n=1 Tax=Caerostris extrusa TaxID=172846 RepID=A0AAV4MP34_CAEEX|nr:hypothetical protein CEXT_709291 [Caerostris extrusa]
MAAADAPEKAVAALCNYETVHCQLADALSKTHVFVSRKVCQLLYELLYMSLSHHWLICDINCINQAQLWWCDQRSVAFVDPDDTKWMGGPLGTGCHCKRAAEVMRLRSFKKQHLAS